MKKNQKSQRERIIFELGIQFMFFLRDRSCLDSYSEYVRSHHGCTVGHFLCFDPPELWVLNAFVFDDTSEGDDFWMEIDEGWNIVLHEFCL